MNVILTDKAHVSSRLILFHCPWKGTGPNCLPNLTLIGQSCFSWLVPPLSY